MILRRGAAGLAALVTLLLAAPLLAQTVVTGLSVDKIALTRMSGSGATVFGLYPSDDAARSAARALSAAHPKAWVKATQLSVQQR